MSALATLSNVDFAKKILQMSNAMPSAYLQNDHDDDGPDAWTVMQDLAKGDTSTLYLSGPIIVRWDENGVRQSRVIK